MRNLTNGAIDRFRPHVADAACRGAGGASPSALSWQVVALWSPRIGHPDRWRSAGWCALPTPRARSSCSPRWEARSISSQASTLGSTIPGSQPGELAISGEDYARWFSQMSSLGLRAVRVYTILQPVFYEELASFQPDAPQRTSLSTPGRLDTRRGVPELAGPLCSRRPRWVQARDQRRGRGDPRESFATPKEGRGVGRLDARTSSPWLLRLLDRRGVGPAGDVCVGQPRTPAGRPMRVSTSRPSRERRPTEIWLAEMLDHAAGRRGRPRAVGAPDVHELAHHRPVVGTPRNPWSARISWGWTRITSPSRKRLAGGLLRELPRLPLLPRLPEIRARAAAGRLRAAGTIHTQAISSRSRTTTAAMPVMITEFGVPSSMGWRTPVRSAATRETTRSRSRWPSTPSCCAMIHDLGLVWRLSCLNGPTSGSSSPGTPSTTSCRPIVARSGRIPGRTRSTSGSWPWIPDSARAVTIDGVGPSGRTTVRR